MVVDAEDLVTVAVAAMATGNLATASSVIGDTEIVTVAIEIATTAVAAVETKTVAMAVATKNAAADARVEITKRRATHSALEVGAATRAVTNVVSAATVTVTSPAVALTGIAVTGLTARTVTPIAAAAVAIAVVGVDTMTSVVADVTSNDHCKQSEPVKSRDVTTVHAHTNCVRSVKTTVIPRFRTRSPSAICR